ncbi:MAG: hypothetical protein QM610_09515 [Chitinophagaceae bacterium]
MYRQKTTGTDADEGAHMTSSVPRPWGEQYRTVNANGHQQSQLINVLQGDRASYFQEMGYS